MRIKVITFTISMLAFSISVFGQNQSQQPTTAQEPKKPMEKMDNFVVDLGYEMLMFENKPAGLDFKPWNNGMSFYLLYDRPIMSSNFAIAIGGGISSQSYYSNSQIRRVGNEETEDYSTFQKLPDSVDYRNNKVALTYLDIPLELRYRSNEDKRGHRWKFTIGFKAGLQFDVHDKLVIDNSRKDKYKTYIFPDLYEFRYGAYFRAGYGKVGLNAYYGLSPLFNEGHGPEATQLSFGVTITPF
ncbi:MAG: porin family protein [Salibacter sp.]|uniref:porin family protein n=1 Tax=Salibacter sp. TaxID=2010995 RepID=UPI0028701DDC|nr:porin family protein [Salibacter sp.]MDR9399418.1 porin family protein [Salibacter sp.]